MELQSRAAIECLLAEDNPGDVQLVRDALSSLSLPIQLHVVDDGEQAVAFLQQRDVYAGTPRPDLVILDLSLPKRRGEEVLATLKGDAGLQTIPVFVALEFAEERFLVRRQGLRPARYLLKPITAWQLLRALRNSRIRDRVNETLESVRETTAYAHATIDWTRKLVQEAREFRQYRRAWAERKAEQQARPGRDSPSLASLSRSGEGSRAALLPGADFLRTADVMREELQKFYSVVRQEQNKEALLRAAEQLQQALSRYGPLVSDPYQKDSLPMEQRWGFLQLLSFVQSAQEALTALTVLRI
jgi:two-component system response regulator